MNQFKNLVFSLIIALLASSTLFSQKDVFALNQFELNAFFGGSQTNFKHYGGAYKIENQVSPLRGLRFQYNRRINRKFQLNAAIGLGAHAFTFALPQSPSNEHTEREHFFNSFQELYIGARYTLPLKNNFSFGLNLGGGVINFMGDVVGISGNFGGNDNNSPQETMRIEYFLNPNLVPFAEIGPQISRTFKNKNELSLKLSYVQSFGYIYEGDYQLFDNTSYGTFRNAGSNLRLSLGYTFTGDRRAQKIADINEELSDYKAAKIQFKKDKRFIHPKSLFVSVQAGFGFVKSFAEDPNDLFQDEFGVAPSGRIMVEKGYKNNFFFETGYQLFEYNSSFSIDSPNNTSSTKNEYFTHQFNFGAGYRVIGKGKNYHYFNLHAGLSIGFIPLRKGETTWSLYDQTPAAIGTISNSNNMTYTTETEILSSLLIAPYVGISKDFRITESMFITLLYRYQHGLNNISKRKITYQNDGEYSNPQTANTFMDGTEHSIQLGLKYKIGKDQ
ncbi:MAG: hypothetical protein WEA99_00305 [Brumimicrobium sp.]